MNDLRFNYLAARNFICFGPEGIEINFDEYGKIVLIRGENRDRHVTDDDKILSRNGAGKSSVFDALVFALFGKTIRKEKKLSQEDVINNKIGKNLRVEVRWGNYRVVRTRKPNSLRVWKCPERNWPAKEDKELSVQYLIVRVREALTSGELVAAQFALGSDPERERHNLERVICGARPSEWNLLFEFKLT